MAPLLLSLLLVRTTNEYSRTSQITDLWVQLVRALHSMNPTLMPDEITQLREEVTRLRRDLDHVLECLDQTDDPPDYPRPKLMKLMAGCVLIRDEAGHIPVWLCAEDHASGIYLHDHKHRPRAVFTIDDDRASFELRNAEGKVILSLGEAPDGSGQIYVAEAGGQPRAGLRVHEGVGLVSVLGETGKALAMLRGDPQGGEIYAARPSHQPGVTIKSMPQGGLITVFEPSGQVMGFFSANTDHGVLSVYGPHGSMAVSLGADDEGGRVAVMDVDGNLKETLP